MQLAPQQIPGFARLLTRMRPSPSRGKAPQQLAVPMSGEWRRGGRLQGRSEIDDEADAVCPRPATARATSATSPARSPTTCLPTTCSTFARL